MIHRYAWRSQEGQDKREEIIVYLVSEKISTKDCCMLQSLYLSFCTDCTTIGDIYFCNEPSQRFVCKDRPSPFVVFYNNTYLINSFFHSIESFKELNQYVL